MNEAIKLAIEKGGYEPLFVEDRYALPMQHEPFRLDKPLNSILIDPRFWQALGRACGWREENGSICRDASCQACHEYMRQWHRFIDWIAEGKNTDDFFTNLIGKE